MFSPVAPLSFVKKSVKGYSRVPTVLIPKKPIWKEFKRKLLKLI
jgi:hypothetical protein